MELIYSVNRESTCKRELKEDDTLCRLSSKNTMAFTSGMDLIPKGKDESYDSITGLYHVYVCDIDKPWDIYSVTSFNSKVICIEWNSNGYQLLIITEAGYCGFYEMKDYLLNTWHCSHKTEITGEAFCCAHWLNQGVKVYLNGDKKESPSYSEKLVRERYVPSLSHFGGRSTEGWIGVTTTGLVCVGLPKTTDDTFNIQTAALSSLRNRITICDIFHEKSGEILIVTNNGHTSSAIDSYRVKLHPNLNGCTVSIKHMTSFFVTPINELKANSHDTVKITNIKILVRDGGMSVIVAMGNSSSSQVDLWNLTRQLMTLKRIFQTPATDTKIYSYHWNHQASITHPSLPVSIALPNLPTSYVTSHDMSSRLFQYVAMAYKDGSMKIISKHTFQAIATTNLDMGFNDMDKPEKRRRVIPYIVTMQQTFTGCGLVGIDQLGCMYMMKVVNTRDTLTHVHPHYLVSILEYLTLTGYDWWDVLISLKPGMIENVIQRLSDNFHKQPVVMQEVLFNRHIAIKSSLYSASAGGQQRAADCHCRLLLHAIGTHFKSQLRPKGLSAQDMGPVEKLTSNCSKNTEIDIDKVMMTLNPEKKEFVVDETTLQALQPLIQWVADLVLYLLTALPMAQGYGGNFPGYSILHDAPCLASLRELMVVIRIWGLINPRCLPHFTTTTANMDAMNEMFKILTKVWQAAKDNKGLDYDEVLIDKCCLLPSQIYVPNNDQALFGNAFSAGCSILSQNHPIKYTYKEVPTHVANQQHFQKDTQAIKHNHRVDIVHQITLGTNPSQCTKSCCRCGNICLLESVSKFPVIQSWEGKWLKQCLCGGLWKKDNYPSDS